MGFQGATLVPGASHSSIGWETPCNRVRDVRRTVMTKASTCSRLAGALVFFAAVLAHAAEPAWSFVTRTGEVAIYQRAHAGSSLLEYKGVGAIEAPPDRVKRVLDDVLEYP